MKTLVVVNVFSPADVSALPALRARFGESLRVVSSMAGPGDWTFPDMDKRNVEWTRRWLQRAVHAEADVIIKIDPDTQFVGPTILPPASCEIAGDFRRSPTLGWIWFGAYQFFTAAAADKILAQPSYAGRCMFQDVALAAAAADLHAYNMPEVNGWRLPNEPQTSIFHTGRTRIAREPSGNIFLAPV